MRCKRSYQYLLQEIEDKLLIAHKDFFWILKSFFFGNFFFGFYLILATHYQFKPILFYSKKFLNPFFFGIKKFWSTH